MCYTLTMLSFLPILIFGLLVVAASFSTVAVTALSSKEGRANFWKIINAIGALAGDKRRDAGEGILDLDKVFADNDYFKLVTYLLRIIGITFIVLYVVATMVAPI